MPKINIEKEPEPDHSTRIEHLLDGLVQLVDSMKKFPEDSSFEDACKMIDTFQRGFHAVAAARFAPVLEKEIRDRVNEIVRTHVQNGEPEYLTLPQKKELSMWITEQLRERGMAICREGKACTLWASKCEGATPQGHFRLVASREAGARTFAYKDIFAYFPLVLVEAPIRKEGGTRWSSRFERSEPAPGKSHHD